MYGHSIISSNFNYINGKFSITMIEHLIEKTNVYIIKLLLALLITFFLFS